MRRCTAVPAAVIAFMLGSGLVEGGGASPPEGVIPRDRFLELVVSRGLRVRETWRDGYVSVTEPTPD